MVCRWIRDIIGMKIVTISNRVNLEIVATLKVLLAEAEAGDIQCLAATVGYSSLEVNSVYCPSLPDSPMDERIMLAEMQIAVSDTSMSLARQDPGTFASRVLTTDDID